MRTDGKKRERKREHKAKPKPRNFGILLPHMAQVPVNLMHPKLLDTDWVIG